LQPELIPTALQFKAAPGLRFAQPQFPKPHMLKAGFSETPVAVFDGEFQVKTAITADKGAKPGLRKLRFTFSYQACDDQMCMMPLGVELGAELEIK
jgi:thiol:disulfide interchange protein DsbD